MYRIIKTDGTELGMTENPLYIRVSGEGCFVPCEENEAVGVAFDSTAYNLFGHEDIDAETVILSPVDGGAYLAAQQSAVDELLITMLGG